VLGLPVSGTIVHVPSQPTVPAPMEEPTPVPLKANTPPSAVPPVQSTAVVVHAG
jgi:hypothetical protein